MEYTLVHLTQFWMRIWVGQMPQFLAFRITGKLPANVVGPKTRWIVFLDRFGKNGCKAAVIARCLTNGNSVTLLEGRENYVTNAVRSRIDAKIGTIQCKLLTAMSVQGHAEIVTTGDDDWIPGISRR